MTVLRAWRRSGDTNGTRRPIVWGLVGGVRLVACRVALRGCIRSALHREYGDETMTLQIQDTFTEAHHLGLTAGFVGTFTELRTLVCEAVNTVAPLVEIQSEEFDDVDENEDGLLAYERHLEDHHWTDAFAEEQHLLSYDLAPLELV